MSNDETNPNYQMTKNYRSCVARFWLRHSFVIRHLSFVIVLTLTAASTRALAEKRNITEKDLFDFVWIGDPQVSPDGSKVAFVKVTVNAAKTNYDTAVWLVGTSGNDEPVRLTSGTRDSAPRWSPDGRMLAFVRGSETPGPASAAQLYVLPMYGGEAFQLTSVPREAS